MIDEVKSAETTGEVKNVEEKEVKSVEKIDGLSETEAEKSETGIEGPTGTKTICGEHGQRGGSKILCAAKSHFVFGQC